MKSVGENYRVKTQFGANYLGALALLGNPFRFLAYSSFFRIWERLGIHITPKHYYQPIPDTGRLGSALWDRVSDLPGIAINADAQERLLTDLCLRYSAEWKAFANGPTSDPHKYFLCNDHYESVDAELLYGMVRSLKPRRMIEVGCGRSSLLTLQALAKNAGEEQGYVCQYTSIDPYPPQYAVDALRGKAKQVIAPVQDVPVEMFQTLGENDILFIDSTHVLNIGSDVQYEILEILPRLRAGVVVHLHDIFFPKEYPRHWVMKRHMFWTEQYLLQAFLAFNSAFEILWAGHYMHVHKRDALTSSVPSYDPASTCPGSFWMRKKA